MDRFLLEKFTVPQLVKDPPHFMEAERPLPRSQELATCQYLLSDQSAAMCSHLSRGLPTGLLPRNFSFNTFSVAPRNNGGTAWRSWLRHCATSRKVAGSIPDSIIGILY